MPRDQKEDLNRSDLSTTNHQFKDKIYLLKRPEQATNLLLFTTGRNGASKTDQVDRERDDLADQGGAVVPDEVTVHKEIRPVTQY